ncbi:MAG TPA: L-histidine N(alpha)-methyltransferase, partial [Acidobacteria bacterium]|nr:L-histidine N(alpha)-methyltransferase [Acidobacteriota bacterium]
LGSGSSAKTGYLLDAFAAPGVRYVPVDVSASALRGAAAAIAAGRPHVQVIGINGVYEEALPLLPVLSPALLIFLGSTIGNLDEVESAAFWELVAASLGPGDHMLLGIDLVKDPAVLEAAYDDAAGVTRRFTKNYFVRMNRELGAGLDVDAIEHEARYDRESERMVIHARFMRDQVVHVRPLGLHVPIAAGERLLVEISRKFRVERMRRELERYGLETVRTFTDGREWFALLLLRKVEHGKD